MNLFSDDLREFVEALNQSEVEYILVGGFAVILYGYQRVTGDMDIWVNRTKENYHRIQEAFKAFGMRTFDMTLNRFMDTGFEVFRFGRRPNAIDLMVSVKGLVFEDCYPEVQVFDDEGMRVKVLHINHLIHAKKQAGRWKDLDDLDHLPKE